LDKREKKRKRGTQEHTNLSVMGQNGSPPLCSLWLQSR